MESGSDLKMAVLGAGSVGKSALIIQYIQNQFITEYDPTIDETYRKILTVGNSQIMVYIMDTAGQEDYSAMREQYIRRGDGFLLVYSITDASSFSELDGFVSAIIKIKQTKNVPLVLCGNKVDLESYRMISAEKGKQKAKEIRAYFLETSAKDRINVDKAFHTLVKLILQSTILSKKAEEENAENNGERKKSSFFCSLV